MKSVVRSCINKGRAANGSDGGSGKKVPNSTREKSNIFPVCDKSGPILRFLVPATDDDDEKSFSDAHNDGDRAQPRSARLFPLFLTPSPEHANSLSSFFPRYAPAPLAHRPLPYSECRVQQSTYT
jgi:hypothetical protein